VAINESLNSAPELINQSSYKDGWIAKVKIADQSDLAETMDEASYKKMLQDK
jgi:glycine cleavage system H protein